MYELDNSKDRWPRPRREPVGRRWRDRGL